MMVAFADITYPLWLVVGQWTLLFALGFLVIVMYRQVGYLQGLRDVGSEREGLPIGEKAPSFDHSPVNSSISASIHFNPTGRWSLLVFADPGCVSCQNTLRALERLTPKLGQTVYVLVVTNADPAQIAAVDAFRTASIDISRVNSDVPARLYRTRITPFGHLIDPAGVVRAKGIAADEHSIQKIVRKVDRSIVNVEFTGSQKW